MGKTLRTLELQPPGAVMRKGGVSYKPGVLILKVKESLSHENPDPPMGSIAGGL